MAEMPNAMTPENIAAVAQSAGEIIGALVNQNRSGGIDCCGNNSGSSCCCPRKIKFFIFGNTWINNYNAACPGLVPCAE
ncbi:MAG: hypothetical protein ACOX4Q_13815 [Syntrophomonadales bacterium]|jgi:hypothetical protein